MTDGARRMALGVSAVLAIAILATAVSFGLERLLAPDEGESVANVNIPATSDPVAHITATLYYVTEDGQALVGVRREVPLGDGRLEQGRQILMLALTPAPPGYVSAIPRGTTLRAFYVTDKGDAFIDLSSQVSTGHPGGSFAELLTVTALVNDVTTNLPAVQRVTILLDGQQVDTLAGHVDLRRPLVRDVTLVRPES